MGCCVSQTNEATMKQTQKLSKVELESKLDENSDPVDPMIDALNTISSYISTAFPTDGSSMTSYITHLIATINTLSDSDKSILNNVTPYVSDIESRLKNLTPTSGGSGSTTAGDVFSTINSLAINMGKISSFAGGQTGTVLNVISGTAGLFGGIFAGLGSNKPSGGDPMTTYFGILIDEITSLMESQYITSIINEGNGILLVLNTQRDNAAGLISQALSSTGDSIFSYTKTEKDAAFSDWSDFIIGDAGTAITKFLGTLRGLIQTNIINKYMMTNPKRPGRNIWKTNVTPSMVTSYVNCVYLYCQISMIFGSIQLLYRAILLPFSTEADYDSTYERYCTNYDNFKAGDKTWFYNILHLDGLTGIGIQYVSILTNGNFAITSLIKRYCSFLELNPWPTVKKDWVFSNSIYPWVQIGTDIPKWCYLCGIIPPDTSKSLISLTSLDNPDKNDYYLNKFSIDCVDENNNIVTIAQYTGATGFPWRYVSLLKPQPTSYNLAWSDNVPTQYYIIPIMRPGKFEVYYIVNTDSGVPYFINYEAGQTWGASPGQTYINVIYSNQWGAMFAFYDKLI